jgi:hypothetical protein
MKHRFTKQNLGETPTKQKSQSNSKTMKQLTKWQVDRASNRRKGSGTSASPSKVNSKEAKRLGQAREKFAL